MDPKLFEQKLSEVCEWRRERHQGVTQAKDSDDIQGEIPTYIKILEFKDRPCPYNPLHKNCDITIKAAGLKNAVYFQRCRSCRGVIVRGQWYDGTDVLNTARFTEQKLKAPSPPKLSSRESEQTKVNFYEDSACVIRSYRPEIIEDK